MSKSYGNTIDLFLEEKALLKKIKSLQTDSTPVEEPKNPETSSIVLLYRHFSTADDLARMETDYRAGGVGYGEFKMRLFEAIWTYFAPMRKRRVEMLEDEGYVNEVLHSGREKARAIASEVSGKVRGAVGLQNV